METEVVAVVAAVVLTERYVEFELEGSILFMTHLMTAL